MSCTSRRTFIASDLGQSPAPVLFVHADNPLAGLSLAQLDAIFGTAHRLAPDNWTYKRQAWSLADPLQGPTDAYDSDWLTEVRRLGAERYYPAVDLG